MRDRVLSGQYNEDIAKMIANYRKDIPDDPDALDEHLRTHYAVVADAQEFQSARSATSLESARSRDAAVAGRISAEYLSALERDLARYERQVQERKASVVRAFPECPTGRRRSAL